MAAGSESLTRLGDRSAAKTTRMGDVVLIDTGDGVFTGRELHDLTTNGTSSIH